MTFPELPCTERSPSEKPRSSQWPRVLRASSIRAARASAFLLAGMALLASTPVTAVDLSGGVLGKFLDRSGLDRDKLQVTFAYDPAIAAPLPDPTSTASSVTFRFQTQGGGAITTVGPTTLVSSNWEEKEAGAKYLYRDPDLVAGGIKKILLKTSPYGGKLLIKARGANYGASPVFGPVDWVEVSFSVGAMNYCGRFNNVASLELRNDPEGAIFADGSTACSSGANPTPTPAPGAVRVPAEWEEQGAIWLQWPGPFEKVYEPAFANMSIVIAQYEKLHILYDSTTIRNEARTAITNAGGNPDHPNIFWHAIPNDNAWMRDNGPTYVAQDGQLRIQDWEFNAWGGAFGNNIPFAKDNAVPGYVAPLVSMPVDYVNVVHERGNLEFNGSDAVILNWSCIGDPNRNPSYTKAQAVADMKQYFGVTKVVLIEGYDPNDLTKGHVDGIARFINPTTVVVGQCTAASVCQPGDAVAAVYDNAAATIAAAGFTVIREPYEGKANYNGGPDFDIDYMNWMVGNGFVIAVGFENPTTNAAAKARLESYFPGRVVHIIDMLPSWDAGGGAHCHTNDQPAASTAAGYTPWMP